MWQVLLFICFVHILILWLFLIPLYYTCCCYFLAIKMDRLCCSPAQKMCTFTYGEDWILQSHKKQIPPDEPGWLVTIFLYISACHIWCHWFLIAVCSYWQGNHVLNTAWSLLIIVLILDRAMTTCYHWSPIVLIDSPGSCSYYMLITVPLYIDNADFELCNDYMLPLITNCTDSK